MSDVAAARDALVRWIDEAGEEGRTFLQLRLDRTADGYRIRHEEDAGVGESDLSMAADPLAARDIALTTAEGEHRPLKTAPNLRRGWLLRGLSERELWTALDYLYPAAALHRYREMEGTLEITPWREVADRQSGIYSAVGLLEEEAVERAVEACCEDAVCLRKVRWGISGARNGSAAAPESVPCPEACSIFVSFARSVLVQERRPRAAAGPLGTLSEAEAEQIRAAVEAAGAGTAVTVREGEFSNPLNQRRLRYLSARLADPEMGSPVPRPEGLREPCDGCPRPEPCEGCPLVADV